MKIIDYKNNNIAYLRTLHNCVNIATVRGYEVYAIDRDEDNVKDYLVHVLGTADICEYIVKYSYCTPEQIINAIEQTPPERLKTLFTVDGKIENIRAAITAQKWTSNGDALFCEVVGQFDLAEKVRANRADFINKRNEEADKEAKEQARIEEERKAKEVAETAAKIEQAEKDLRNSKFIKADLFEALCDKYGVELPIKLIGWLREYCNGIEIKPFTAEERKLYEGNYSIRYGYIKGHKSTSIGKYAEKLAAIMRLNA